MKKPLSFLGCFVLILLFFKTIAYAGAVNQYEAEVLEAAKGQFEYDGKLYKVDKSYIEKLSDYLASDEVDLSEEDKDQILASVNNYIITGVTEGFLMPTGDAPPAIEPSAESAVEAATEPVREPIMESTLAPTPELSSIPTSDPTAPAPEVFAGITMAPPAIPGVQNGDSNNYIEETDTSTGVAAINQVKPAAVESNGNVFGVDSKYVVLITIGIAALIAIGFIIIKSFITGSTSYKHRVFHSDLLEAGRFMDIHTHILPGVDDGSSNMEETQKMLSLAIDQRIGSIIATPHYACGAKNTSARRLHEIRDQVHAEAVKLDTGFQLYLGNELFYSESIVEALQSKEALTLAGSRYILVEFSPSEEYRTLFRGLGNLVRAGYAPILAHMERYQCLEKKAEQVFDIIELGCYIQINCSCLIGGSVNRKANYFCDLINRGLIHFIASDCHNSKVRTPGFAAALEALRNKVDEETLERVLIENPRKIIENVYI